MNRLETAVSLLRKIEKIEKPNYTLEEFTELLDEMEIEYSVIEVNEMSKIILNFDEDLSYVFALHNDYCISLYKLYSRLVSKLSEYYNELDVEKNMKLMTRNMFLLMVEELLIGKEKQIGINELIVRYSSQHYHDDDFVAMLMFLKHFGMDECKQISYVEVVDSAVTLDESKEAMKLDFYDWDMNLMITADYHSLKIEDNLVEKVIDIYNYQKTLNK